jgi:hypothetical protein
MQYEVLHRIKHPERELQAGAVIGVGVLFSQAQVDSFVETGFLKPLEPDTYVRPTPEPVAAPVPTPVLRDVPEPTEDGTMTLDEMNMMLMDIDPDFVCETAEEARAMLERHTS